MTSRTLFLFLVACTGSTRTARTDTADDDPCADMQPLTWDNAGQALMGKWCVGCHSGALGEPNRNGAPLGVDFDTLEGLQAYWDDVLGLVQSDHPPSILDDISDEELALLEAFLTCSSDR